MCIKCFSRWRDKYISSVLYSICQGLNSFFSFKTKKKTLFDMFKNYVCCFFLYKNSLDTHTRFWVDGEWNRPYVHLLL